METALSVLALGVWIGVGLMWLWNGWRYRQLTNMKEAHERVRMQIHEEMLGVVQRDLVRREAPAAEVRH